MSIYIEGSTLHVNDKEHTIYHRLLADTPAAQAALVGAVMGYADVDEATAKQIVNDRV
jgi:hypothetical protein